MEDEQIKRDSMVMYRSFFKAIENLDETNFNKCIRAIYKYGLDGEVPTEGGIVETVFELVKPQIDANNRRWKGGCKGGRPKKNQEAAEIVEEKPKKKRGRKPKAKVEELPAQIPEQVPGEDQGEEPGKILEPAAELAKPEKEKQEVKESYGEYCNVLLSKSDYEALCESKGEELTNLAIKKLDEYIESLSPTKKREYLKKNHRMCLHTWGYKAAEEELYQEKLREESRNGNYPAIKPFRNPRENDNVNCYTTDELHELEDILVEN